MIETVVGKNNWKFWNVASYAAPSAVSVFRVLLAAFLIVLISGYPSARTLTIVLGITFVFSLDAMDGVLARSLNRQTLIGSFIDIAADRAVEFIFIQHLLSAKLIPRWFLVAFYGRILVTDLCRALAFSIGKVSAVGIELPQRLRPLVLSRISRTGYGTVKAVFFGTLLLGEGREYSSLFVMAHLSMFGVVAFSMIRAIPIVLTYFPRRSGVMVWKRQAGKDTRKDVIPRSSKVFSYLQFATDLGLAGWLLVRVFHW